MDIETSARSARQSGRWPALLLFVLPFAGTGLLGVPAGFIWRILAPRPELLVTREGVIFASPEPSAVIAADGWFAVITAVAGLLCGAVTYALARRHLRARVREIAVLLSLTAGGLLAALIAWYVGRAAHYAEFQQRVRTVAPGTHLTGYLQLHAVGLLVAWPLIAVLSFTVLLAVLRTGPASGEASDDVSHKSVDF